MRGMRMILSVSSGAKQGIQFQSVMRAADGGYGSQGNCIQS
jgi:hypothetical protein